MILFAPDKDVNLLHKSKESIQIVTSETGRLKKRHHHNIENEAIMKYHRSFWNYTIN